MTTVHTLGAALTLALCAAPAMAQAPANDNCSTATPATLGFNLYDCTNSTAGSGQALDPMTCDMGMFGDEQIHQDVWFTFNAATTGLYDFTQTDNGNPAFDGRMAIYNQSGCPDSPANVIACNDDISTGNVRAAMVGVALTAGSNYIVRVGTYSPFTAGQPAALEIFTPPPPPANDDCSSAIVANLGSNTFTSDAATEDGQDMDTSFCDFPIGSDSLFQDVWFTFTPGVSGNYDIEVVNNGLGEYDSRLAIYNQSTCPDDPTLVIDCDDDGGDGLLSKMDFVTLTSGTTYLIRAGTYLATTTANGADLFISMSPPPPANDTCATAIAATLGVTGFDSSTAGDGSGLALDPVVCDLGGDDQMYQDIWYTFTPAMTDFYDLEIVNNGSGTWDTHIAVYDQSTCPDDPANVIACDDDDGEGSLSLVTGVSMTGGTSYLIRIGSGTATTTEQPAALSISVGVAPPPPAPNDDCSNSLTLMVGANAVDGQMASLDGLELDPIVCDPGTAGDDQIYQDVWYTFTPSVSALYDLEVVNSGAGLYDSRLAIYNQSTCPDDPATVIGCDDDDGEGLMSLIDDVNLTAGTTYLIRLGTFVTTTVPNTADLVISADGVAPGPQYPDFCNGDGGNQMGCTACPCGNESMQGTIGGCINSAGTSTRLAATGSASVSLPSMDTTDLRFTVTGSPPNATNVLISGNAVAPANMASPCFGTNAGILAGDRDGLRCAVQATVRHGNRSANAMGEIMDATGPNRVWGGEAQPVDGIAVQGGFASGQTRYFQITHRDDALAVCMRGLNTSQAVQVVFTP